VGSGGCVTEVSVTRAVPVAPPECHYEYGYDTCNVGVNGAVWTAAVAAPASCSWTAAGNVPFVTIAGGSGTGGGILSITIGPHSAAGLRSGTVTVSGYPYAIAITQQGCTYGVSPRAISVASAGGPATVTIAANGLACSWAATSYVPFVATTSGSGSTGEGTVVLAIAPNPGAARTGTVTVAGDTVTVTQAGP
jgi:hypothetical protein